MKGLSCGRLLPVAAAVALLAAVPARGGLAPVSGPHGAVATAHPLASRAALAALTSGGTAADAAVAAAFALAVVEPYSSGLGGGGVIVAWDAATRTATALDCRETAPAAAAPALFRRGHAPDPALSQTGALAVATPGLVRGLAELHGAAGRLPWAALVQPALRLAGDGFVVDRRLAAEIAENSARLNAAARAALMPGGAPPAPGDTLRQPDLARTLAAIAAGGADAFYAGPLAAALAAGVRAEGGVLSPSDLASYRAVWREPVRGEYRGLTVWTMPPPSSGGVLLVQMLNVLGGFDLRAAGAGSAAASHPLIEAMKLAFAARGRWLGDTDFVTVPVARLTSRAWADSLRGRLRDDRALGWQEAGDTTLAPPTAGGPGHTTHVSVVDAAGNAVAATLTINLAFGSGLVAAGTGVVLNDEMDDFALAPGVPNAFGLVGGEANAVAAGKRPLSSMTPTVVTDAGGVRLVLGSPGGSRIITSVLQVLVNVVDFGMPLDRAVAAPRLHQQWVPAETFSEPWGLSPDTVALLVARGHRFVPRETIGNVQAVQVDSVTGLRTAASDPRGLGEALGY